MALSRTDETDLVTAVHEGPFEQPLWSTFLSRLRRRTRADYAGLVFRPADAPMTEATELFAGRPTPVAANRHYFEEAYRFDPLPYHRLRPERVYGLDELLDADDPLHGRFRREYLEAAGINHMRVMRIVEPGGFSGWLSLSREKSDFGAGDGAVLAGLARHLGLALRSFAAIERERIRSGIAEDAMRRLNFGWMMLAADSHLIDLDANAERILQHSQALRRTPGGRLLPTLPAADRALIAACRAFAADPLAQPRAIHLADDPWMDMLVLPIGARALGGTAKPVLVAYVHGDPRASAQRREQLGELFGLSGSEAGLALALSRGRSIAEAAAELGLTVETARNYSKRIYAKTGTRGQADLVRLILASVVALA